MGALYQVPSMLNPDASEKKLFGLGNAQEASRRTKGVLMHTWAEIVIVIELWAMAMALWVIALNSRPS